MDVKESAPEPDTKRDDFRLVGRGRVVCRLLRRHRRCRRRRGRELLSFVLLVRMLLVG